MKIFLDGTTFSRARRGGILRTFQELPQRITNIDSSVPFTLYLRRKLKDADLPRSLGIEHLYERSIYPGRWLFGKYRTQDYLLNTAYLRDKPDIFHTTYFTRPLKIHTPYVVSVYDMIDEIYAPIQQSPKRWQFVEQKRKCIQAADLILTNSQFTTRDLLKYSDIDEKKVVTVPLGVDSRFFPIQDKQRKKSFLANHGLSRPYFIYVVARRYNKNFKGLLRA